MKNPLSFFRFSLLITHKILFLLAGSITALTLGLAFAAWYTLERASQEMGASGRQILSAQTEIFLEQLTRTQAVTLDVQLEEAQATAALTANLLSRNLVYHPFEDDLLEELGASLKEKNSHFKTIYFVTPEGRLWTYPEISPALRLPPDFNLTIELFFPTFPKKRPLNSIVEWSRIHADPLDLKYDLLVDAVAPVVVDGKNAGYLGVSISLTQLMAQFNHLLPIRGSYSFLMDERLQLVAAPPHARVDMASPSAFKPRGPIDLSDAENSELGTALRNMALGLSSLEKVVIKNDLKYLAYCPLRTLPWRLGLVVPVPLATSSAAKLVRAVKKGSHEVLAGMLFWAVILLTAALLLGAAFTRRLTTPIRAMATAAEHIARGNFSQRVRVGSGDEIGQLAMAFNTMTGHLQTMISHLERVNQERWSKNRALENEIRERERIRTELQRAEEKYRMIFENAAEGIFQSTPDGRFRSANSALAQMFGYDTPKELMATVTDIPSHLYVNPDDRMQFLHQLNTHGVIKNFEHRVYRRDGSIIWIQTSARSIFNARAEFVCYEGFSIDITERKESEENLRLMHEKLALEHEQRKRLSRRLIELLERDRRKIAMELHDDIGQILTTLKMDLEWVSARLPEGDHGTSRRLQTAREKSVQAIRGVKEIAFGLRPSVLDNLGLVPSIRNLINEIRRSAESLQIRFFHQNVPKKLSAEKQTTLYRVVQEALHNVVKHARSRNVFVNLTNHENSLWLGVEDDGVGFDYQGVVAVKAKGHSPLGLLIMQERVVQVDGELSIESRKGAGTHLLVQIPLTPQEEEE